jgi:hypothetical protein
MLPAHAARCASARAPCSEATSRIFTRMGRPHVFAMEHCMFSLKFDLLFPTIGMAKAAARKLNSGITRKDLPVEPRELYRMQQELRDAQERIRYQVTAGRLFM